MTAVSCKRAASVSLVALLLFTGCSLLRDLDELEPGPGAADAATSTRDAPVPRGTCPDAMVERRFDDVTRFCIDRFETTMGEYKAFLDQDAGMLPAERCAGNLSLDPAEPGQNCSSATFDPVRFKTLPVVCVDQCDAQTYCRARGARLCGGKGGATLLKRERNTPSADEWFLACSGGSRPFSGGPEATGCVFSPDAGRTAPEPAASVGCTTPEGVEHLSGNVGEWTNDCERPETDCVIRGGNLGDATPAALRCDAEDLKRPASFRSPVIGFRCCSDL